MMIRQKLKSVMAAIALMMLGSAGAVPAVAVALPVSFSGPVAADSVTDACSGLNQLGGNCGSNSGVSNTLKKVVKLLAILVGGVSVIMVMLSGFRYITSAGDANKAAKAKSTLIYALIGLAIASLAGLLARFVVGTSNQVTH